MLRHYRQNLADSGLAHGGWVLQKLDDAPFDPASTPSQSGLRDGDLIYLRPRMAQIPDMVFDDVPDVVATGVKSGRDAGARMPPASSPSAGASPGSSSAR